MTDEELTFETATQELDSILEKLDGDDVNIDSLAVDLERFELIERAEHVWKPRESKERIVTNLDDH